MGRLKILFLVFLFYPVSGTSVEESVYEDSLLKSVKIDSNNASVTEFSRY